jgi:branched-chain amino acid transport system ATP-binding protein
MTSLLIELDDVRVSYGGAGVLWGISLSVEEGKVVCLIGGNGAGKTTTLRTISGLKRPSGGEIRYRGESIIRKSPPEILALGISHVPQEGRIFRDMTVYENLRMGAYLRKDKSGIAEDLQTVYEHFPILQNRSRQPAGALSGGERQMLAIGRALMSKPRTLIMDEPTLGLAPIMVKMLVGIISRLNDAGISVILVEQNADFALKIAHFGYVMERGRIVTQGNTKELLTNDFVRKAYLGI